MSDPVAPSSKRQRRHETQEMRNVVGNHPANQRSSLARHPLGPVPAGAPGARRCSYFGADGSGWLSRARTTQVNTPVRRRSHFLPVSIFRSLIYIHIRHGPPSLSWKYVPSVLHLCSTHSLIIVANTQSSPLTPVRTTSRSSSMGLVASSTVVS